MLIGVGITTSTEADPLAEALAAESSGYDFVSASDHPHGPSPSYETPALLGWIAARTTRIRIATRVLAVPFRRPAMLAKWAETLQRLSGARLILGLGGGYSDEEITAVGASALSPGAKVDGLADAIEIIHGAWSGDLVTHAGRVHSVHALQIAPTPDQPIPIWLGTYGPRALAVTGRLADGWIPSFGFAPPAQIPVMLDRIRTAAAAAGRTPDAVRAVYNVPVRLATRSDPDVVAGTAADVIEQLQAFTELGFTGFNLMPIPDQAQAVAEQVLPALRELNQP